MKKKVLSLLLICTLVGLLNNKSFAQRPATVVSIVKEDHTFDYYKTMARQWKKMVDTDKSDADAWFNYYYANRYARMYSEDFAKSGESYFQTPESILKDAEKAIPGTFEYYFMRASEHGMEEPANDNSILKAYKLRPDKPILFPLVLNLYELQGNKEGKQEICRKWFNSNDMSPALLNYNYNVLMSMEDNSILITNGDNDTYPVWLLQEALGIKKKVTVLNIALTLNLPEYRDRLFKELKIPAFSYKSNGLTGDDATNDQYKQLFLYILQNSPIPVYLANTLAPDYYYGLGIEKDLYIVGLAMRYNKTSIDNLALIRNNYENNFLLDYLDVSFTNDPTAKLVSYMDLGYELMLLKLFEHYTLSGEKGKAENVKKAGLEIARKAGMEDTYKDRFITN
jgi:hypothetical protein